MNLGPGLLSSELRYPGRWYWANPACWVNSARTGSFPRHLLRSVKKVELYSGSKSVNPFRSGCSGFVQALNRPFLSGCSGFVQALNRKTLCCQGLCFEPQPSWPTAATWKSVLL